VDFLGCFNLKTVFIGSVVESVTIVVLSIHCTVGKITLSHCCEVLGS